MRWTCRVRRVSSAWTTKPCGPDAPTLASSLRVMIPRDDGGYQARHTEESAEQSLTPSCRECRLIRLNLWSLAPVFLFAGGPWVRPSPGIPCALDFPRDEMQQSSKARTNPVARTRFRVFPPAPDGTRITAKALRETTPCSSKRLKNNSTSRPWSPISTACCA